MTPIQAYQDFLWSQEEKITKSLPSHLTAKRFISSTCSYLESHPKIIVCDRGSIMDSIIKAAQMGLVIDGIESALVPRKSQCTLMVMFQGLLKMVRNSGELKDIQSAVVYEKDQFDYYTDESGEHLIHRRAWGDRGVRKLVFAIARTKDGGIYVEVMDTDQVMAVKKQGYSSGDSPWNGPFQDEMWRKSVIRRLSKRLPSSTDMESFSQDLEYNDPEPEPEPEPETTSPATSTKLSDLVKTSIIPNESPEVITPEVVKVEAPEGVEGAFGVVDEYIEREYKMADGSKIKRYAAKIDGVAYGTSDPVIASFIKTAHEQKNTISIAFQKKPNASGKMINEIMDIGNQNTEDEKPI